MTNEKYRAKVAIIGGGPAGLMAAEVIIQHGLQVDLYDAMPSVGRKFLMAGKSGLNITHSEAFSQFVSRFAARQPQIEPMLREFTPEQLRQWVHDLGIETFVGSSGRVFPKEMKAAPLLRAWLHRLRQSGVHFHMRHRWIGWDKNSSLCFSTTQGEKVITADATVLALGGGSWPKLGSDASWIPLLAEKQTGISPLKPANCGFYVNWSDYIKSHYAGQPMKSVSLAFRDSAGKTFQRQGEFIISQRGVEGSLIYAVSAMLRDEIALHGSATIYLDLAPNRDVAQLEEVLSRPRGSASMTNHLRKKTGLDGVKAALLREYASQSFNNPSQLANAIKSLPITLIDCHPIEEAISTAGGVEFNSLDAHLMLKQLPGVFCAGEMLDWEAPTGGYLLTACFASGRIAGKGVLSWLDV